MDSSFFATLYPSISLSDCSSPFAAAAILEMRPVSWATVALISDCRAA
jgi:hypothetical protein